MIGRCACVTAAMVSFWACAALGQGAAAASGSEQTGPTAANQLTSAKNPDPRQLRSGRNPLSRISIDSLSGTRERPLFSASRRPPTLSSPQSPAPNVEAPLPLEPERPPLTLQGTAIGKPQGIAVVLDEMTKGFVRLHVGEATEGWYLRSIDQRTVTVEKNGRAVILSFPALGGAPASTAFLASDEPKQPKRAGDGRPRARNGANWISKSPVLY